MIKKFGKIKRFAVVMVCAFLGASNISTPLLAQTGSTSIEPKAKKDVRTANVLTNLSGDETAYSSSNNIYSLNKKPGNNILISEQKALSFEYETIIKYGEGLNSASLVFGANKHHYNNFGTLFGFAIEKKEDNKIWIKMFQDGASSVGGVLSDSDTNEVYNNATGVKVKLIVKEDKSVEIYINDNLISTNIDTNKFNSAYMGGYIGMMSFESAAEFSELQFTKKSDMAENFNTTLTNFKGLSGTWTNTSTGMNSIGTGDEFAISDTNVTDFTYSANIKNNNNEGAGSLAFGIKNNNNPKEGSYIMNVDQETSHNVFKLFHFPEGGTMEEIPLGRVAANTDGSYDLRVTVKGKRAYIEVNNKGILDVTLKDYEGGNLGLLTWKGNITYQNLNHSIENISIPDITYGTLSDFKIETENVTMTPKFDKQVKDYGIDIPSGIDNIVLKPQVSSGDLYVTLKGREGNIIKEKTKVKDSIILNKEDFETQFLNMELTIEKDGFIRVINYSINKWFSTTELANQELRSQFHVTPQVNFMNDPNGMVYDPTDGYWHLNYQQSTKNNFHNQAWNHVRSKDLVNWEQMPLAIQIDDLGLIFSGSAISLTEAEANNENILDGVFKDNKDGESRLVSFYTYAKNGQSQALAYSKDHGTTWIKYKGNPILGNEHSTSGVDFRDPKVFKVAGDDSHWYMITAGGAAQIFVSSDLIHWTKNQDLKFKANNEGVAEIIRSECPGLNPTKIEGTNEIKWIYNASDGFYIIGNMVKDDVTGTFKWIAESDKIDVDSNENPWAGFGKYANMTFYEDGTNQGRHIGISWIQDTGINFDGRIYRGAQTLPFEWQLKKRNNEYIVVNKPVKEIENLRDMDNVLYSVQDKTITDKSINILKNTSGIRYDVEATFTLKDAKEFGFKLRKGNGKELIYKYDVNSKKMILDIRNAGTFQNSGNYSYDLIPLENGKVKLRIIIDQGVIEAFGNDGEAAISTACYTNNEHIGMEFYSKEGSVLIDKLNIYDMKSMYSKKSGSQSDIQKLYLSAPSEVEFNSLFTIDSNIYPNLKDSKDIIWDYDSSFIKEKSEKGSITLKATKEGEFIITGKTDDNKIQKEILITVSKPQFNSNVVGWDSSEDWKIAGNGIRGNNLSKGDVFLMSDTVIKKDVPFTFEADLNVKEGQAAGLVFGIKDKNNPGKSWYCINIDKIDNKAKLFKNTGNQDWFESKNLDDVLKTKTRAVKSNVFKLKLISDGKGKITYYANDVLVGEKENSGLEDGYIGMMTFKSNSIFNNVRISTNGKVISVDNAKDVSINAHHSIDEAIATLAKTTIVKQDDGLNRSELITWDTSKIDMSKAGTYTIEGSVFDCSLKTEAKVIVKENKALNINDVLTDIVVKAGSSIDDLKAQLPSKVAVKFEDELITDIAVVWNSDSLNLMAEGSYTIYGKLEGIDLNVEQKVIVNKDGSIPDKSEPEATTPNKDIVASDSPKTGITNRMPLLYTFLLSSLGMISLTIFKRRSTKK